MQLLENRQLDSTTIILSLGCTNIIIADCIEWQVVKRGSKKASYHEKRTPVKAFK